MSDQTKPGNLVPADQRGQLVPADKGDQLVRPSKRNLGVVLGSALSCELQPLEKPQVDPDVTTMPAVERAVEVLRYNAALCEYRLGSNGWLRAWIFSTLRVLFLVLVPLLAFSALLAFLVPAMAGVAQIFASIAETSRSLFWATIYLLLTAAAIGFAVVQFRLAGEDACQAITAQPMNVSPDWGEVKQKESEVSNVYCVHRRSCNCVCLCSSGLGEAGAAHCGWCGYLVAVSGQEGLWAAAMTTLEGRF